MGLYDGVGGSTTQSSAYDIAKVISAPIVLAINARGASLSLVAIIKGMMEFRENSNICGVILNNCSESSYKMLSAMIEAELSIPVLGYLPNMPNCTLKSRHLGLVTADEITDFNSQMMLLAEQAEKTIKMEELIQIAASVPDISANIIEIKKITDKKPRIAVAKDEAFCFYYQDNLELLQELGGDLVKFSPIHDEDLPPDIDAIYLGGGYPELYLEQLSQNIGMKTAIKNAIQSGIATFAECGGFMYLHENICNESGNLFPMVAVCKGTCSYTKKLGRFGYIQLTATENTLLCEIGDQINAHEFHYYDSNNCGEAFLAQKPKSTRQWDCIVSRDNIFAGFPHLYFYSNINFANQFVLAAAQKRGRNETMRSN